MEKIKFKDLTGHGFKSYYMLEDSKGSRVSVSTSVAHGGVSIFTFDFLEDYRTNNPAKRVAYDDKEKISAVLDYINSDKFAKDIKSAGETRELTTSELEILERLEKIEPGDQLPNIQFTFPIAETVAIYYVRGMEYDDFEQLYDLARKYSHNMFELRHKLGEEISQRNKPNDK